MAVVSDGGLPAKHVKIYAGKPAINKGQARERGLVEDGARGVKGRRQVSKEVATTNIYVPNRTRRFKGVLLEPSSPSITED